MRTWLVSSIKGIKITHEASETAANHRSAGHVSPKNKSKTTRAREKYGKEEASVGVPKEDKCSVIAIDRPFSRADLVYPNIDVRYRRCNGSMRVNAECTR